ncbi:hypothetical protein M405DRAFT_826346 [Rhizopogon salebrosus TDB-379]|nr:hypothetical protein M405DRAFT_826346 [Rhizopogon salebrosus TDB-379]
MAATSSPNSRMLVDYHGAFSITHEMVLLSNPYLSSFPPPCSPTLFRITSVPQSSANRRRRTFAP